MSSSEEDYYVYQSEEDSAEYEYAYDSKDGSSDSDSWSSMSSEESEVEAVDEGELTGLSLYERALKKWGRAPPDSEKEKARDERRKAKKEKDARAPKKKRKGGELDCETEKKTAFNPNEDHKDEELLSIIRDLNTAKGRRPFGDIEVVSCLDMIIAATKDRSANVRIEVIATCANIVQSVGRRGNFEVMPENLRHQSFYYFLESWSQFLQDPTTVHLLDPELESWEKFVPGLNSRSVTVHFIAQGILGIEAELIKALRLAANNDELDKVSIMEDIELVIGAMWKVFLYCRNEEWFWALAIELLNEVVYHLHWQCESEAAGMMERINERGCPQFPKTNRHLFMRSSYWFIQNVERKKPQKKHKRDNVVLFMLYMIFNLAQNDEYDLAATLARQYAVFYQFINSESQDVKLKIFYNRALAACGLAAFRRGRVEEAQIFLQDICYFNRARELLAQGTSQLGRGVTKSPELDRLEYTRLLPTMMHLDIELIETVHNVSAMLTVVPMAAKKPVDNLNLSQFKDVNRYFVHCVEVSLRSALAAPPSSARDHMMHCIPLLARGRHNEVMELLLKLKIWEDLATGTFSSEDAQKCIKIKVAHASANCFKARYQKFFSELTQEDISKRFGLTIEEV